ncbi:MAG: 1-acyl-sn-glycerol-3-phosphate acyltransferase [Anaerolineaceae bacterium]|nr:1-acyl-sn-glycerol-3-phosphate acyltransferase [Anaerolineaceae bacterium]
MQQQKYLIQYPRKHLTRFLSRVIGRFLLKHLTQVEITGMERYPQDGPLIVIGNHIAVMEPVMLAVLGERQLEFIASIDIPHEPTSRLAMDFYGYIPIFRGKNERKPMRMALDVLAQNGVVGIFPEGGVWNPGAMKAKSGVALLSHRSGARVLPVAFSGTFGALNAAFAGKKPRLQMRIGEPIPALQINDGDDLRQKYEQYSAACMEQVNALLPEADRARLNDIESESFKLEIQLLDHNQQPIELPSELTICHPAELAHLLHRAGVLSIFKKNLHFPVEPLMRLHQNPEPDKIAAAVLPIIEYLTDEQTGNPHLLTYRFGLETGTAMLHGLRDLHRLALWSARNDYHLRLRPIRRYFSRVRQQELIQVEQSQYDHWR